MHDPREPEKLVNMYAHHVEDRLGPEKDAYALAQVLGCEKVDQEVLTEPWRRFFEPQRQEEGHSDPILRTIDVESRRLKDQWIKFQGECPAEERVDLQHDLPTIEGLVGMVKKMNDSWTMKRSKGAGRKALEQFHRFCSTLNSHSSLLAVLPQQSEYVSVFSGALTTTIKASVNHEKIAEGLSESLWIISEHIGECNFKKELFPTSEMKKEVADFYAHIFLFLSDVMKWMTKKRRQRFLDSFNEDFNKTFEDQVSNIRASSEKMGRIASLASQAEVRSTRLTVERLDRDFRVGQEGQSRERAEQLRKLESLEKKVSQFNRFAEDAPRLFRQLGADIRLMLSGQATGYLQDVDTGGSDLEPLLLLAGSHEPQTVQCADVFEWMQESVSVNSSHLEDFFERTRVRLAREDFDPIMISPEAASRLGTWTETPTPQVLWLSGPHVDADSIDNPMSILSAKIIHLVHSNSLPVISYFCELRRREPFRPGNGSREVQAMLALLYAILRQAVELLPPIFETKVDLSERRFLQLDGTLRSWAETLEMLRDLLELMPRMAICVIDGIQWLDDMSTKKCLKELIQALRHEKLKVLFTTAGKSRCLLAELSISETLELGRMDPRKATIGFGPGLFGHTGREEAENPGMERR